MQKMSPRLFVVVTVYRRDVRWVFDVVCRRVGWLVAERREEVLAVLLHGDVDGGSAMAAVQRLVAWATRQNSPDPRPFE